MRLGQRGVGRTGEVDRGLCDRDGPGVTPAKHVRARQGCEHPGAFGRWTGAFHRRRRRFEDLGALLGRARYPCGPREALVGGRPPFGFAHRIDQSDRDTGQVHGQIQSADDHRSQTRLVVERGRVNAIGPIVRRDGIPQPDRMLERADALGERIGIGGGACGRDPGTQGAHGFVRRGGVVGEGREQAGALRAVWHRPRIEGRRVGGMEAASFRREEIVVDGLGEQGVAESVATIVRVADQELRGERLAERLLELRFRPRGHLPEQARVHRAPGYGGHAQDALGILGQGRDPREQHLAQGVRQSRLGAAATARREELLDEEGIALRPSPDRLEQIGLRRVTDDRLDLCAELRRPEPRQLHPSDPRQAVHLREPRPEWMPAMQLVRSIRPDDDEALGSNVASQEGDEIPGRAVRPVQVLEDAHDRRPIAEVAKEREDALEDPRLGPFRAPGASGVRRRWGPELGQESTELGGRGGSQVVELDIAEPAARERRRQSPQGLDDRCIRQAAAISQADAAAFEEERATLARASADFVDQPGLADAGLAADEDDGRLTGTGPIDGLHQGQRGPADVR